MNDLGTVRRRAGSFHEVFKSYIWELGRHFRELRSYEVTNSS